MALGSDFIELLIKLGSSGLLQRGTAVMEIGAQQLANSFVQATDRLETLGQLFDISSPLSLPSPRPSHNVHGELEHLDAAAPLARHFWTWLGFECASIDIEEGPASIILDLNYDSVPFEARGKWDLVTNCGTTEHVANQLNAFKVIHDLTTPGGIMIHSLPTQGMFNHGLVNYNFKFFWMLARSNGYKFINADFSYSKMVYELPVNIVDFLSSMDPTARDRTRHYQSADAAISVVLQKSFDIPFVPPLDVPTGTQTNIELFKQRYWTIFEQGVFERLKADESAASGIAYTPDISICMVNFNSATYVDACLRSIYENLPRHSFEIIVVDNASQDNSIEIIRERFPLVRLIENDENRGFVRGNNQAIRASKGQYVFCLNADTVVLPNALDELIDFMQAHPEAGACGPRVLNADKTTQHQCKRGFPTVPTVLAYYLRLHRLFPQNRLLGHYLMTYLNDAKVNEIDSLSGAAMMVRRSVIDQVGMMDEDYFMYMDDIDWCYRIKQAGWKVYYVPAAQVIHFGGKSSRKTPYKSIYHFYKSQAIFYRKHYARYHYRLTTSCVYLGIWCLLASALTVNAFRRDKAVGIKKPERGGAKPQRHMAPVNDPPAADLSIPKHPGLILKRVFDIALSAAGLLCSWPLWAFIAICIKLEDRGPVFYFQKRVGKNGKLFWMAKFRSMIPNAESQVGAVWASQNDPRVTRVGRVLRATAMDELPQLWNILKGDLSFVGPRAERPEFVETFRVEIPNYDQRLQIRPGLTGPAQVYGRYDSSPRDKLRLDLLYIKKQHFGFDIKLIVLSFWITFRGKWEYRGKKIQVGW